MQENKWIMAFVAKLPGLLYFCIPSPVMYLHNHPDQLGASGCIAENSECFSCLEKKIIYDIMDNHLPNLYGINQRFKSENVISS